MVFFTRIMRIKIVLVFMVWMLLPSTIFGMISPISNDFDREASVLKLDFEVSERDADDEKKAEKEDAEDKVAALKKQRFFGGINYLQETVLKYSSGQPVEGAHIIVGAVSNDGKLAACGQLDDNYDGTGRWVEHILLIDLLSGKVLNTLDYVFDRDYEHSRITLIKFSADNQFIFAHSTHKNECVVVWQWNAERRRYVFYDRFIVPEASSVVTDVTLSKNGEFIVLGDSAGLVKVFRRGLPGNGMRFFSYQGQGKILNYFAAKRLRAPIQKIWFLSDHVVQIKIKNNNRESFFLDISENLFLLERDLERFLTIKKIKTAVAQSYNNVFPGPDVEVRVSCNRFSQPDMYGIQTVLSIISFYRGSLFLKAYCEVGAYKILYNGTVEKVAVLDGDLCGYASNFGYVNDYANYSITIVEDARMTVKVFDNTGSFCGMVTLDPKCECIGNPVFSGENLSCLVKTPDDTIKLMRWTFLSAPKKTLLHSVRDRETRGRLPRKKLQIPAPAKSIQAFYGDAISVPITGPVRTLRDFRQQ